LKITSTTEEGQGWLAATECAEKARPRGENVDGQEPEDDALSWVYEVAKTHCPFPMRWRRTRPRSKGLAIRSPN